MKEYLNVPTGKGASLRVKRENFRNVDRLDLRMYYAPNPDEPFPTKRGISIPLDQLSSLRAALQAAEADAIAEGLIQG